MRPNRCDHGAVGFACPAPTIAYAQTVLEQAIDLEDRLVSAQLRVGDGPGALPVRRVTDGYTRGHAARAYVEDAPWRL